jgi:hypothetical protein
MIETAPPFDLHQWLAENVLLVGIGAAGVLLLVGLAILLAILLRSRPRPPASDDAHIESFDVAALDPLPPAAEGPQLEVYGIPVRLAILVIAPPGRGGTVPAKKELAGVLEYLVPNLGQVLMAHQPLYVRWPPQLSSQGFLQTFFNKLSLPGEHGKGTVWCSVAGKFEAQGHQYLVGLLCCAASPNGLGEIVVEHPGHWLHVIRATAG